MKKISIFLISLSLLIVSNNTFRWYQNRENNVFQFGDWLINYQGGFVRRGFFGELFFRIYEITNISPSLLIFIFLIFLYLFFGFYCIKLLKKVKRNTLTTEWLQIAKLSTQFCLWFRGAWLIAEGIEIVFSFILSFFYFF